MRCRQTRPVPERQPPFYVGLDIGTTRPHADVLEAEGTPWVPTVVACANTREGDARVSALLADATTQVTPSEVMVGGQATGPDWLSRYEALSAQGSRGLVLHPLYVKARRDTTRRGTQTAPVEARLMAEIVQREDVPTSQVPAADVPGLRALTRLRADWVAQMGDVKRRIISILDRTFPEFAPCFTEVCGQAARTLLATWAVPEALAGGPTAPLAAVRARLSHGHLGAEKAREVKAAAHQRIGVKRAADALACERHWLLRQIRELERLVAASDRESNRRYAALAQDLRPVPGLGAATAPAIYAEIGDIQRFTDADQVVALAGADP